MENKFKKGDKVHISQPSEFHHQGIKNGKKLVGVVNGPSNYGSWQYDVTWEGGNTYLYNDIDLVAAVDVEPNYEIY